MSYADRHFTRGLILADWNGFTLTLKPGVPQGFATETLVILDPVDDDGPAKDVCKNENVGLLQAGSWLGDRNTGEG